MARTRAETAGAAETGCRVVVRWPSIVNSCGWIVNPSAWIGDSCGPIANLWPTIRPRWPTDGDRSATVGDSCGGVGARWPVIANPWAEIGDAWPVRDEAGSGISPLPPCDSPLIAQTFKPFWMGSGPVEFRWPEIALAQTHGSQRRKANLGGTVNGFALAVCLGLLSLQTRPSPKRLDRATQRKGHRPGHPPPMRH